MNVDISKIEKYNPCKDGLAWFQAQPDFATAWQTCERGDWMLWYAQNVGVGIRPLTLAKARCAKLVIHLMKDEWSRNAVEVAERFGLGEASREELGDSAFYAAYFAAAYYAAAEADAADHDAAGKTRKETLSKFADICRGVLTKYIL